MSSKRIILLVIYMFLLAYISLQGRDLKSSQMLFQYVNPLFLHLLAYFFLTILFFWSFSKRLQKGLNLAFLFAFSYGFLLETAQIWVPGRTFSLQDILANLVASGMGGFFLWASARVKIE